ncbi:MAG: hypothetical protein IH913_01545 [Proteobacteria bacterium]|nr:hypothetical protein [Pseudomonadota bacterium]
MKIEKRPSLRKCIDDNCKNCIYDPKSAGTWRQQVALCSVTSCALYPVRPVTKAPIPESVLKYYGVTEPEIAICGSIRPPEGLFNEQDSTETGPTIRAA